MSSSISWITNINSLVSSHWYFCAYVVMLPSSCSFFLVRAHWNPCLYLLKSLKPKFKSVFKRQHQGYRYFQHKQIDACQSLQLHVFWNLTVGSSMLFQSKYKWSTHGNLHSSSFIIYIFFLDYSINYFLFFIVTKLVKKNICIYNGTFLQIHLFAHIHWWGWVQDVIEKRNDKRESFRVLRTNSRLVVF